MLASVNQWVPATAEFSRWTLSAGWSEAKTGCAGAAPWRALFVFRTPTIRIATPKFKTTVNLAICKKIRGAVCLHAGPVQGEMDVDEQSERLNIPELTTEIVAAYVSYHKLRVQDVPNVIKAVGGELASLGTQAEPNAVEKPEPVVSVRRSVRADHLVCLICGKKQKLLKRHLAVEHELTPNQYRETFGLKPDYPMAAPNYTEQRRELALSIGLGRPKKPARRARKAPARPKAAKQD
jgi:predicted transcriptional regulator